VKAAGKVPPEYGNSKQYVYSLFIFQKIKSKTVINHFPAGRNNLEYHAFDIPAYNFAA